MSEVTPELPETENDSIRNSVNQLITEDFPVVALGASAGGLAALEAFFKAIPKETDMGIAFVIIQHLAPQHKSMLMELVSQFTAMKVYKVVDGISVEKNCVYIIPQNTDMLYCNGKLKLTPFTSPRGQQFPIDSFFRSLAVSIKEKAIGIILSGTGSDGSLGLKEIKAEGGIALVQSPATAAYDGMPRSALFNNDIDYVLAPEEMPAQIINFLNHFTSPILSYTIPEIFPKEELILQILLKVRDVTGHNFSHYKPKTILRRIERRLAVNRIGSLEDYLRYLTIDKSECEKLFRDLLIGVTGFFRDPEAFETVKKKVFPYLFNLKSPGSTIRVWIPGCSTGEEPYSMAILFQEYIQNNSLSHNVQIFATDIDNTAISKARAGVYPDNIIADVSPERLSRFFISENNSFRLQKSVRDTIVFATQNIIHDPPFSRIDFVCCRNLLIYFDSILQKKVISLFHYSLNPAGFLFLGNSETTGDFTDVFPVIDKKWKIYSHIALKKNSVELSKFSEQPMKLQTVERTSNLYKKDQESSLKTIIEYELLQDYSPPCVVINFNFEIQYFWGQTSKFIEPAEGVANLNLIKMLKEGLKPEVVSSVRKVIADDIIVRHDRFLLRNDGKDEMINLVIKRFRNTADTHKLIVIIFEPVQGVQVNDDETSLIPEAEKDLKILELQKELKTKEDYLHTAIEELETTNEELMTANEELQASNEELQSTNEELETSKEELQSVNEELITVNSELQKKLEELSQVNNDMNNLLAGTGIATIFVDYNLIIRRFTPAATQIVNLIQTDMGRPLSDIAIKITKYEHLANDITEVLNTLIPKEAKVETSEGLHFNMRIQPYRTLENVIEGAVLTFIKTDVPGK